MGARTIRKAKRVRSAKGTQIRSVSKSKGSTNKRKRSNKVNKGTNKATGRERINMAADAPPSTLQQNEQSGQKGSARPIKKRFKGRAKKGEVRNPLGRPLGSKNKGMPDYRKMKSNLLDIFMDSRAPAVIKAMLNLRLPEALTYTGPGGKITLEQDMMNRKLLLQNFKWAADFVRSIVPKELGIYGELKGEITLTGLVKRATTQKSTKAIELVEKETEDGLTEYCIPSPGAEEQSDKKSKRAKEQTDNGEQSENESEQCDRREQVGGGYDPDE